MTRLLRDIADSEIARLYPAHGTAQNSQGIRLLWFPIVPIVTGPPNEMRARTGYEGPGRVAFADTLGKLAVSLRQLHMHVRSACDFPDGDHSTEATDAYRQAVTMVPLYFDLSVVYLRRLPDLLVLAARPLLFRRWRHTPTAFKEWIKAPDNLLTADPVCDRGTLRTTLAASASWFDELRAVSPTTGKKGLRDALEHRNTSIDVAFHQSGDERPRLDVFLSSDAPDVHVHQDVHFLIPTCVAGLCELMTGMCIAMGAAGEYQAWDARTIPGNDADTAGYWPAIAPAGCASSS